jgi:hypothetical protein
MVDPSPDPREEPASSGPASAAITEIVVTGANCPWCLEQTLEVLRDEPGVIGARASSTGHCLSIEHHDVEAEHLLEVVRANLHGYDRTPAETLMVQIDPHVASLHCTHGFRAQPPSTTDLTDRYPPHGMETILDAADRLRSQGYLHDLTATNDGRLRCGACGADHDPASVEIDAVVRYEGASDPDDEEILLALRCGCSHRGLYQAAFGPGANPDDAAVLRRLP